MNNRSNYTNLTLEERIEKAKEKTQILCNEHFKNKIVEFYKLCYNEQHFLLKLNDKKGVHIQYKPESLDKITVNLYDFDKDEIYYDDLINFNQEKQFNRIDELKLEIRNIKNYLTQ